MFLRNAVFYTAEKLNHIYLNLWKHELKKDQLKIINLVAPILIVLDLINPNVRLVPYRSHGFEDLNRLRNREACGEPKLLRLKT